MRGMGGRFWFYRTTGAPILTDHLCWLQNSPTRAKHDAKFDATCFNGSKSTDRKDPDGHQVQELSASHA